MEDVVRRAVEVGGVEINTRQAAGMKGVPPETDCRGGGRRGWGGGGDEMGRGRVRGRKASFKERTLDGSRG